MYTVQLHTVQKHLSSQALCKDSDPCQKQCSGNRYSAPPEVPTSFPAQSRLSNHAVLRCTPQQSLGVPKDPFPCQGYADTTPGEDGICSKRGKSVAETLSSTHANPRHERASISSVKVCTCVCVCTSM